jgi:Protein tyrosine kinase.
MSLRQQDVYLENGIDKEKLTLKRKNIELLIKNHYLSKRSFELGRIKLETYLKKRTIRLGDSALFSDHIGYCDEVLLETDIEFVETSTSSNRTLLRSDNLYNYYKFAFKNGELATLKTLKTGQELDDKSIIVLSHELKILQLVGSHKNVIMSIGLVCPDNCIFGSLFRYDSAVPLKQYLKLQSSLCSSFIQDFIIGFCEGLLHIHSKDILHNLLTEETVVVGGNHIPIITNFSWACRVSSASELTHKQKQFFEDARHFPLSVRNGHQPPSTASDRFSFGMVLRRLIQHRQKGSLTESVNRIANSCFCMEKYMNLWASVNKYIPMP